MIRRPHATAAGRPSRRAGFTLLEMLVVIWALSIALVFGATLLIAALRVDQVGAATLRRLAWWPELADQFRTDVARAAALPDRLGDLTRGPGCLILRTPDGAHVIYRWLDEQLERIVRTADRETRRTIPVGTQDVAVEFDHAAGDRPVVTLRLVEAPPHGTARRTAVAAALGGDLR
jgi:prepilin-type N-terminal cleavage/methylation domain-containing protein